MLFRSVKYKPDYAEAYYWHGNYLYGEGKYAEAIVQLDKALKADPSDFHALDLRAGAKQFLNKFDDAIADYNLLEAKHPQDFNSNFDRAKCYQAVKKHKEAIADWDKVIEKAMATGFESSEGYVFRGISKAVLGKKTDAQTDFDKAIEVTILKNNTRTKIGCMLVEYGFYQDAIVWLDKALESQPIDDSAEKCKVEALARLKK